MSDFKKLHVFRKAHALVLNVYRVAATIRGSPHTSLRNQLIRAAMSIPTNIVEGTGQESAKEFGRFLSIAMKSASEVEYHLTLAGDIKVIRKADFESLTAQTIEVRRMLYGLRTRVVTGGRITRSDVPTS